MMQVIHKLGMIVAMLLSFITASAYDFEVDGIYYNITSKSNLEVGVTHGSNETPHNHSNSSYSGDVVIPATVNYNNRTYTVTSILPYAMGCTTSNGYICEGSSVITVTMPNTITSIGEYAFTYCRSLVLCPLPSSIKTIESYAFAYTALTEAHIPNATTKIGNAVFYCCAKLINAIIGDNVSEIGSSIFRDCTKLMTVIVGNSVSTIEGYAFGNCSSLLEVFFTGFTPPTIADDAFYGTRSHLEKYVPSVAAYGFGKEYISFSNNTFVYTGQPHTFEWSNNLKAYKCEISEAEFITEVNAGTYSQNLKATYSNGVDLTVEIPYTYTINKAPMTLAVNNVQREYGEPNPAFTCNISGFVNGENEQSLGITPSFECEATQLSNVGTYRIIASLDAPNYEITYNYGTLSIIKAPISLGVINATKIYGDNNPTFSMSYIGLKNGETEPEWISIPTFSTSANQASRVGEYEVTASGGNTQNYDITSYSPGMLSITKRNLTAKANDCKRLYGEENPTFKVYYVGFVNSDDESSLTTKPVAACAATKESNAGKYPISVTGGLAENYNFVYQDGQLTINPLTVGFKVVYNSVAYNDMSVSTTDSYFNFIPEITGPFSEDDFWIELWFLDGDNRYDNHVATISSGDYAGDYVNTNSDRPMYAGKYIFNLTLKGRNPNVVANPSRAYVTVNRASNNLEWNSNSPIVVGIEEKVDLGITYQADLWCTFNTDYDKEFIELSSDGETGNTPHWYATGLKEGETTLYFSIECKKNDMGFYDFTNSRTLSKRIKVVALSGIEDVMSDDNSTSVIAKDGSIYVLHKDDEAIVRVFSLQGTMVADTSDDVIDNLPKGLYIVTVDTKSFKILL